MQNYIIHALICSSMVDPPEKIWKLIIPVPLLVFRYDLVRPDGGQGHVPVKLAQHRQPDVLGVAPADGHMMHSTYRGATPTSAGAWRSQTGCR